jgi:hypothetical protein
MLVRFLYTISGNINGQEIVRNGFSLLLMHYSYIWNIHPGGGRRGNQLCTHPHLPLEAAHRPGHKSRVSHH